MLQISDFRFQISDSRLTILPFRIRAEMKMGFAQKESGSIQSCKRNQDPSQKNRLSRQGRSPKSQADLPGATSRADSEFRFQISNQHIFPTNRFSVFQNGGVPLKQKIWLADFLPTALEICFVLQISSGICSPQADSDFRENRFTSCGESTKRVRFSSRFSLSIMW